MIKTSHPLCLRIGLLVLVLGLCSTLYADFRPSYHVILQPDADGPTCVYAADLDGDGDLDILLCSSSKIAWIANDGYGKFGTNQIITASVDDPRSVCTADLDGDGNQDVLSASSVIVWYKNE